MAKILNQRLACINPECGSSDARRLYDDGTSFCFSCQKFFPADKDGKELQAHKISAANLKVYTNEPKETIEEVLKYPSKGINERGISKEVCEHYGVRMSHDEDGNVEAHYYPYGDKTPTGYKKRTLPKEFKWIGKSGGLFGKALFSSSGKRLVITEGEIDALSVAQAVYTRYKKFYPVVSIPSATSLQALIDSRDWVRSFKEVVLCLDADERGEEAVAKAVKIIGPDKVKIAKYPKDCKDANDVLVRFDAETLNAVVWDAEPYIPNGIITKEQLWEALTQYNEIKSVPYPACLEGLNTKLKGMRPGEISLFISGTGSGKSTVLREIMLHVLAETDDKIGIISLEESPAETARKLAGMYLNRNPANEEIPLDELRVGFDKVFSSDKVILLDHQGSIKDESILDQLEYMALSGCRYLFIDHITILVSEGTEGLSGNEAIDKVMNDLLRLVKRHDVWVGLVSHLRKTPGGKSFEEGKLPSIDDIRGSGSIKQISFDIISFARDLTAKSDIERNSIKMRVLKSRYTGLTGSVPGAYYEHQTGRLRGLEHIPSDDFDLL